MFRLYKLLIFVQISLLKFIGFLYAHILLILLRAQFGSNTFIGLPIIICSSPKSITLGKNNRFASSSLYNPIGINRNCTISTMTKNAQIKIGNNSGFSGVSIGSFDSIEIGSNCKIGANTLITDSDWHLEDYRSGKPNRIVIKDGVWIGINCVVLKGVTIGENSLIGANSVVTKNIPPNTIAVGNPCKVIKHINND